MAQTAVIQTIRRTGRPSDYNPEIAAELCSAMAEGQSLRTICKRDDMPSISSVFRWMAAHSTFREQYARAAEARLEAFAEDIVQIGERAAEATYTDEDGNTRVDTGAVQAARLQADNLKWIMSKLSPRKWGDKLDVTVRPGSSAELTDDELARIAAPTTSVLIEHRADEQRAPDLCTGIDEQDQ